jgi:hypothetical protein
MNATYMQGRRVVPNFSTQPTWMYNTPTWNYPSDPNTVDFGYPRGNAFPNTTQLVAEYYGRLLDWLVNGQFTDEFGQLHTGGPAYKNLTHWEVFNEPEGCHGLDINGYIQQYDAVVAEIRRVADPEHRIKFVGLALASRNMGWIVPFLNASNHAPGTPLDVASFHFYASQSNRTNPTGFESFFSQAAGFLGEAQAIAQARDTLSPNTWLSCDEMGVVLGDDNGELRGRSVVSGRGRRHTAHRMQEGLRGVCSDAHAVVPPTIYYNAVGGMYAFLVPEMTKLGIEVRCAVLSRWACRQPHGPSAVLAGVQILGASQLAGSPPIPQWDIPEAQYPSVALINWTNGQGNPRYWVLKMFIEEVSRRWGPLL